METGYLFLDRNNIYGIGGIGEIIIAGIINCFGKTKINITTTTIDAIIIIVNLFFIFYFSFA